MKQPRSSHRGLRAIFAMPLIIAVSSFIALIVALTGDGWRDATSWAGLGLPVVAVIWAIFRRRT